MKIYDLTDHVRRAWEYYDKLLDVKIQHIHELTGVEKERLIKLNPAEMIRDKEKNLYIENYHYQKVGDWVAKTKTPDTFCICPIDEEVDVN